MKVSLNISLNACPFPMMAFTYAPHPLASFINSYLINFLVTRPRGTCIIIVVSLLVSPLVSPLVSNAFFSETTYSIFAKFYRFTGHVKTSKFVKGIFKIWLGSRDIEF